MQCMMGHTPTTCGPLPGRTTRRRLLFGAGAATTALLAGCAGDDGPDVSTDPIDLAGRACEVCGMIIDEHPGPNGQVFFADGNPPGRDGPARFDSMPCLRTYLMEAERKGWETAAILVTDYSVIDYEIIEVDAGVYISSHTDPDDFADATELVYVIESGLQGAMGPATIPFSDAGDAAALIDEYGGERRQWDELPAPSVR